MRLVLLALLPLLLSPLLAEAGPGPGTGRKARQAERTQEKAAQKEAARQELMTMSDETVATLSTEDVASLLDKFLPEVGRVFRAAKVDGAILSICATKPDLSPQICGLWNPLRQDHTLSDTAETVDPPRPPPPPVEPPPAPPGRCAAMGGVLSEVQGSQQCDFEPPTLRAVPAAVRPVSAEPFASKTRASIVAMMQKAWEGQVVKAADKPGWKASWLLQQGAADHGFCTVLADETDCNYEALTSAFLCYKESLTLTRAELPHGRALAGLAGFQLLHDGVDPSLGITVESVTKDLEAAVEQDPEDWLSLMTLGIHHRYHILVTQAKVFWPASKPVSQRADGSPAQVQSVAEAQGVLFRAGDAMVTDLREAILDRFSYPHA
jgi:hypothetical protein